jgi:hypothetical protein
LSWQDEQYCVGDGKGGEAVFTYNRKARGKPASGWDEDGIMLY